MKIELTDSITHDGQVYTPGVHDLPDELARLFLEYEWAAREFVEPQVKPGGVKPVAPIEREEEPAGEAPKGKKK